MMWTMTPWSYEQHKANAAEKERRARQIQQGQRTQNGSRTAR